MGGCTLILINRQFAFIFMIRKFDAILSDN